MKSSESRISHLEEPVVQQFNEGRVLALSRLISAAENRPEDCSSLLAELSVKAGKAHLIGITGPPGAGKSTLVNALIRAFRKEGQTVAVLAVDPSSPFSGGAILGDRIRMLSHYDDDGVFVRSLSTRGAVGGLSRATQAAVTLCDAFGFDKVIVETVGVGQTEFQILNLVHTTVVVWVPESGDSIQTQKAGLLEVADIFVVNKADRAGASRMASDLDESVHLGVEHAWKVPVLMTKAREEDGYDGVPALVDSLNRHRQFLQDNPGKRPWQATLVSAALVPTAPVPEIVSRNPATGQVVARFPEASAADSADALERAALAQRDWARESYTARARYLLRLRDIILEETDILAALISEENGKPVAEAFSADLFPVLELLTYYARHTERLLAPERICLGKWTLLGRTSRIEYGPIGVIGIISPWNFPFSIPMGQIAMSLMAGNSVILKPSEVTPRIGLKMEELWKKAGLPTHLVQVLVGGGTVGERLVKDPGIDKIIFTGSVATGKKIMAAASETLTPVVLELGGKDAMIVLEDADIDVASSAALWGAFTNCGQCCASVERLYVHDSIYAVFMKSLVRKARKITVDAAVNPEADVGPMTFERQREKVAAHVADATARGAEIVWQALPNQTDGFFYPPTILTQVPGTAPVLQEETFGPVLPVMRFRTEEEVIRLANDSPYALTASVWSKNRSRGLAIARALEAGTVTVNEVTYTFALPQTPWGGPKESGIGRTHGKMGLLELVEPKHIHINYLSGLKSPWWYPYTSQKLLGLKALADLFFNASWVKRLKAIVRLRFLRKVN